MAEFLLGRIKFVWKNNWATSTAYVKDDVIRYGGKVYICTDAHTSDADFYNDLGQTRWNIFADGSAWKDEWTVSTYYKVGDIVKYGGFLYIANNGHTSADTITKGLEFNLGDWDTYAEFFAYKSDWAVSTRYKKNDIVKYGGTVYVCIDDHTSSSTATSDDDGLESDNDGKALTIDTVSVADAARTQGTYNNIIPTGGTGTGVIVTAVVDNIGGLAISITDNGSGYTIGDVLTITDANLGGGGAANVTFRIASVANRWNIYSEGFDWKNNWDVSIRYKLNDLVKYGGQIYVCITGHKSAVTLADGLEVDQSKWQHFHKGIEYRSTWQTGTRYRINDIAKYGANIWICTGAHTATSSFATDESNWSMFVPGLEYEDSWSNGEVYQPGDIITYGGYSYIARTNHSGRPPYNNASDWKLYLKGYNFRGDYGDDSTLQDYLVGDVVRLGGYTYMCIQDHQGVAKNPASETLFWTKLNEGFAWKGDWVNITDYVLGDVVYHGVNSYVVVQAHQSNQAIGQKRPDLDVSGTYYKLLAGGAEGSNLTTDGDLLIYNGAGPARLPIGAEGQVLTVDSTLLPAWKYWGRTDHVYYVGTTGVDGTYPSYGSTLDRPFKTIRFACEAIEKGVLRPNATNLLKENRQFIQREAVEWVDYQVTNTISPFTGSFTYNKDKCYRDVGIMIDSIIWDLSHGGNTKSREAAYAYFTKAGLSYVAGQETETVAALNYAKTVIDAVITNLDPASNYQTLNSYTPVVVQRKDSTVEESEAQGIIDSLVAIITDAITAGVETGIPALEQVQKTVFVKTGEYKEVLPIRVPANTAVVGDELRSTRIKPSTAADYTQRSDIPYSIAGITRVKDLVSNIVQGTSVTKTPANTQTQVQALPYGTATEGTLATAKLQHVVDYINYFAGNDSQDSTAPTMTTGQSTKSILSITGANPAVIETSTAHGLYDRALINIKNVVGMIELNDRMYYVDVLTTTTFALYEDFRMARAVDSTGYESYTSGGTVYYNGNVRSADQNVHHAARSLYLNKEFLAEEATAYITATYPAYTYSVASCKDDIRDYIDAVIYDLVYGGTYATTFAARFYSNAVDGSLTEDMFYLRNGTGLRNCSLNGLTGVLGADNAYGTKRPTAGAFTSLDPGWGPADDRTYIINKSPYIQNVSTFGTAAVGCKIDGALHDSGNDSIVSNDFTQIISDGIGVWCTNLGRTELVSVFSYYGHIGYLAENGGKIRATNGNSSYGTFGCVAEGVDVTETVIDGTVNNRYSEALVGEVLTDQDKVLALFYDNAGINYENVTYTVTGDGAGASVLGDEFRDQALFDVRMLNTDQDADGEGDFGGKDYGFAENTAQFGDTTSIRISNTDTGNTGDYDGMRIILTSGLGVGQYGYIGLYNAGNKDATVFRESDGQPGWDHFVPGTTVASILDGTTKYKIEPRVTISEPPFSSTQQSYGVSLQSTRNSIAYGNDRFITVGYNTNQTIFSQDGTTWASGGTLPATRRWSALAYGAGDDSTMTWVCAAQDTNEVAYSTDDGATWTTTTNGTWASFDATGCVYAKEKYVMISGATQGFEDTETSTKFQYSADGVSWTQVTAPVAKAWKKIIFGLNEFVVICDDATFLQSLDGITWNQKAFPAFTDTNTKVKDIAYGNGRYLMIGDKGTQGFYSLDGTNWVETVIDTTADSSIGGGDGLLEYGAGVFLWTASRNGQLKAIDNIGAADASRSAGTYQIGTSEYTTAASGNSATFTVVVDGTGAATVTIKTEGQNFIDDETITIPDANLGGGGAADLTFDADGVRDTSQSSITKDGIYWKGKTNGKTNGNYSALAFGNPGRRPTWFALQNGSGNGALIRAGAQAFVRARVATGKIAGMRIFEPGSGYSSPPNITITDPSNTIEAPVQLRIGDGALAQPTFISRGSAYETASATLAGDGSIDKFQNGSNIFVEGLSASPKAGSNVTFDNLSGNYYKLVVVRELQGPNAQGKYSAKLQVSPNIPVDTAPPHADPLEMRIRYSQVRLTGHDFLDIGTGNFANTNYPGIPLIAPVPASETVQGGGGRVFFTSTDQDGNFRVGDLFSVEQSTGVATLDADAFNVAGLNELSLGSVELGGTGAVITEFSTDGTFAADSDNIVPTQKAIRTFINAQIGGGNSELNVNILTAGVIEIKEDQIDTTTGVEIKVKAKMNFTGGIDGDAVALQRFLLS